MAQKKTTASTKKNTRKNAPTSTSPPPKSTKARGRTPTRCASPSPAARSRSSSPSPSPVRPNLAGLTQKSPKSTVGDTAVDPIAMPDAPLDSAQWTDTAPMNSAMGWLPVPMPDAMKPANSLDHPVVMRPADMTENPVPAKKHKEERGVLFNGEYLSIEEAEDMLDLLRGEASVATMKTKEMERELEKARTAVASVTLEKQALAKKLAQWQSLFHTFSESAAKLSDDVPATAVLVSASDTVIQRARPARDRSEFRWNQVPAAEKLLNDLWAQEPSKHADNADKFMKFDIYQNWDLHYPNIPRPSREQIITRNTNKTRSLREKTEKAVSNCNN